MSISVYSYLSLDIRPLLQPRWSGPVLEPTPRPPSITNGLGTPDPTPRNLVNWCFWYKLVNLTIRLNWLSGALFGVGGPCPPSTREMGGAPRNPAPRSHFLVWIVKPSGFHCTDGHLTSRVSLRIKAYRRVPTPLRSTSPFSDSRREHVLERKGQRMQAAIAREGTKL